MTRFYTYEYLRKDGAPYYVGKGKGKRAFHSHRNHCPKDRARIRIQYWADEATAFEMEKFYIRLYGRKDNGTGILRNLTDGGEGTSNPSEETRRKLSEASLGHQRNLGYKHTEEARRKIGEGALGNTNSLGNKLSEEQCRKMSEASKKQWQDPETRLKMSEALTGRTLSEEHRRKLGESIRRKYQMQSLGFLPFPLKWQEHFASNIRLSCAA
jgi:hypothetical protein